MCYVIQIEKGKENKWNRQIILRNLLWCVPLQKAVPLFGGSSVEELLCDHGKMKGDLFCHCH